MKITAKKMSRMIDEALPFGVSHQLKIARDIVNNLNDVGISILGGGMTKQDAIEVLKKYGTDAEKKAIASGKLK